MSRTAARTRRRREGRRRRGERQFDRRRRRADRSKAAPRRLARLLRLRRDDCAPGRAGAHRPTARAYFRRSLLYAVVAGAFFWIPRPSADGRPFHPSLDGAVRRLRNRRQGAFPPCRRRDAGPHRADRLAFVRLGGEGRACGADVGRDAAGPRRRGLRHPRRAAGGVLDPRPCGSRRALAHRRGALAGRARAGARAGAGIEVHRRLFRRRGRPGSGRRAVAAPLARLAGAVRRTRRRAGDFRPLRRLERRARLGDFRQAARTRAAARFCALLYRRIPCFSGRPHQPARLRRPRPRRRDHPVARAGFAPLARRGPARPRLHDRAGGGLFPSPLDPRPCPGQLARAALSGGGDSGRRLGRRGPPRRRFGPLRR